MKPVSEVELTEAVAGAEGPLRIVGGGTRPVGRAVEGETLSVAGIAGVVDYEPGALTLVAKAGTPVEEVERVLAAEGQRLAFEPMDHRGLLGTEGTPTIGGVVAANVSGPRRVQAGACRDFLLGVRFVDGMGRVLKNGGRVMKNVTGYDLVKLMAGSRGTLGVLTEVSFKVLPKPEAEATLIVHGPEGGDAVALMAEALGSPYDVTGAAHFPLTAGDGADTMIRLEGFAASVAYRVERLKVQFAGRAEMNVVEGEASGRAWAGVRDVRVLHEAAGDVWRVSVKPSDAGAVLARLPEGALRCLDWGGGLIWVACNAGHDLRGDLAGIGGHATLVRASEAAKARLGVFQPEPAPIQKISQGLRDRFDPRGILNPGLMG